MMRTSPLIIGGEQINADEAGETCSRHGSDEICIQSYVRKI
jgi:hypothetical protein